MPSKEPRSEPDRPLCTCGAPGMFQVLIHVQELVLERDAGISARPYWTSAYRTGTRVDSIMCVTCVRANVQVSVTANATIEKGRVAP
jgi:hypothetical protein